MTVSTLFQSEDLKRRLLIAACVLGIAAAGYWVYQRIIHVYTDDARIAADMLNIATEVSGPLLSFPVRIGQEVEQGEVLAHIDARKVEYRLAQVDAQLAEIEARRISSTVQRRMADQQAGGALGAARSRLDAARALGLSAESDLAVKAAEWRRAESLRARELMAPQDWERARSAWQQAQQAVHQAAASTAAAQAAVVEAEAQGFRVEVLDSELVALDQQRAQLQAERGRLQVELEQHTIRAPISGVVDETFVKPGEHVSVGQRLLLIHDPRALWVDANVKETEVRHLRIGQSVALSVDAYPGRALHGELIRIGHAATSEFALLPSTNPSGNFTKITQRLPLRISIVENDVWLRPGMMVEVAIDVRGS